MDIRPIDVFDDDVVARWHSISTDALAFGRDYPAVPTLAEAKVELRRPDPGARTVALAAFDGPSMVGTATVVLPQLDNTDLAEPEVCVGPTDRRRGIGSALVDEVVRLAHRVGRKTLLTEVRLPYADGDLSDHPYARFATRHGFSIALMDVHRVLDLPLADSMLDELERRAAPHHRDYRIVSWVGACPQEYAASFADLFGMLISEAPMGELDLEPERYDVERLRADEERLVEQRRQPYGCAAIAGDGELVAYTLLFVPGHDPGNVYQGGTLVRPEHRGHRLGLAVKARALRAVQLDHPDRLVVHTWNAEVNTPMVAVNDAFGFRPVEYVGEFQRRL